MEIARRREQKLVLVVDDSYDTREVLEIGLLQAGYRLQTARNGREALRILQTHPVDIVLTDLNMPEMSGAEFIEAARADVDTAGIPIIVMTAASNPTRAAIDADAFMSKPLGLGQVLDQLARISRRSAPAIPQAAAGGVSTATTRR